MRRVHTAMVVGAAGKWESQCIMMLKPEINTSWQDNTASFISRRGASGQVKVSSVVRLAAYFQRK